MVNSIRLSKKSNGPKPDWMASGRRLHFDAALTAPISFDQPPMLIVMSPSPVVTLAATPKLGLARTELMVALT